MRTIRSSARALLRASVIVGVLVVATAYAASAAPGGNQTPASVSFAQTSTTQAVCSDDESCFNVSFTIANTAQPDPTKRPAENVEVTWTVVQGAELVSGPTSGVVALGNIQGGESKTAYVEICTLAPLEDGQSIKIEFKVTREDSRPDHNIGKRVNVDVVAGDDCPPPVVIAEAPNAVLLPVAGAAAVALGGLFLVARRRATRQVG
jgi:hypothetical protein